MTLKELKWICKYWSLSECALVFSGTWDYDLEELRRKYRELSK